MKPKDPEFESRVRASFARQEVMKALALDSGAEKRVATMTCTLMAVFERDDVRD
ncbi:MAG TPA: hypothetical protein VH183_09595 [Burkholderiaceae bacterium]|nr:hypothetical protein [Burkholderiaceae bacterium]